MMEQQYKQRSQNDRGANSFVRRPVQAVRARSGKVSALHELSMTNKASATSILARNIKSSVGMWSQYLGRVSKTRLETGIMAVLVLVSVFIPVFGSRNQASAYDLSKAQGLLTPTPKHLQDKLTYDMQQQAWVFNKDAANELPGISGDAAKVGGVTYSAQLPTTLAKTSKVTMTDAQNKLDMAMAPQFAVAEGKSIDGHLVYPLQSDRGQLVYTFQSEGVKEDIVLYHSPGNTVEYKYKLDIPNGLEARLQEDGSIGIFGGDKTLFGNISYASDKDRELVEKARANTKKDTLYYVIPAPVITGDSSKKASAEFSLDKDTLTIKASGLRQASYPLSIDPSFVLNTAGCSWLTNGNNEGNVDYSSCQLGRSKLSGGTLVSWGNAGGTTFSASRMNTSSVVSNGFVYLLGGDSSNGSVVTTTNTVNYAPITTSGTIGAWNPTTSLPDAKDSGNTAQAYNGYIYLMAGSQGSAQDSNNVWYAAVCTGSNTTTVFSTNCSRNSTPGTISGWAAANTGATFTARIYASSAVYNGYIYILGGCSSSTGAGCTTAAQQDVNYAKINGDGTLGAWTSVAGTYGIRYLQSSIAYNGYLYVIGGCTAQNALHNCSATGNDVWYTSLDASTGAPGTWTQSPNTLPVGMMGSVVGVSNGYLYMVGGCTQTTAGPTCNTITPLTTVAIAQLYANGGVGVWRATTSLGTGRSRAAGFAYGGYVFVVGGCTNNATNCNGGSGTQADSVSAQINTIVGNTSSFGTTTNYYDGSNPARLSFSSVAYGGYIYIIGGTTDNHGGVTSMVNTARYAAINSDGSLGTWATSSTGFNNQTTEAGKQCTGAGNCPGRTNLVAGAYNGYLYIAGGWSNASGQGAQVDWSDVQAATICTGVNAPVSGCAGAGDLQSWTTISQNFATNGTYAVANGASSMGMQIYNGRIYLMGGINSSPSPNGTQLQAVYYGTLNGNGAVTFQPTTSLQGTNRSQVKSFVANNRLYIVGGGQGGLWLGETNNTDDIYFIPIKPDGTLDGTVGWKDANAVGNGGSGSSFSTSLDTFQVSVSNGYLYITGGQATVTGAASTTTKVAKILSGGGLGSWTAITLPALSTGRYFHAGMAVNGYLYAIGGCSSRSGVIGTSCNSTAQMQLSSEYAQIYNGGGGAVSGWTSTGMTSLPDARRHHGSVAYNGYLYILGGQNGTNSWQTNVYYSPITNTGNGAWTSTNAYTTLNNDQGVSFLAYNGYMYKIGGTGGVASIIRNDVQYAPINSDGSLGTWKYTWNNTSGAAQGGGLTAARWAHDAVAYNGRLYVSGGCTSQDLFNPCLSLTNTVETAAINADGTVGAWSTIGTNLPSSRWSHRMITYNGYIYVLSGCEAVVANNCSSITTRVDYAHANSSGLDSDAGCGAMWCRTADTVSARKDFAAYGYNGYLYVIGGQNAAGSPLKDATHTPIFANGTLGSWMTSGDTLLTARSGFGTGAAYNGKFYILGGCTTSGDCNGGATTDVQQAGPQSTAQIAQYSMLLTTDARTQPANYFTAVTPQNTGSSINVTTSTTNAPAVVFTSISTRTGVTTGTKYLLTTGNDGAKYYRLFIVLDDSLTATFDETSASTLSYLQLNYHANPGMRLRGGKTFNQNVQQSLDAY